MGNVSALVHLVPGIMQVNILAQNVIQNVQNVIYLMEISVQVVTLTASGHFLMDRHVRPNVLLENMAIDKLINVFHVKLHVKVVNKAQMIVILAILNQLKNFLYLGSAKISVISDILFP